MRLDADDKTIVQPDIMIICEREEGDTRSTNVPDLAAEVLSPSTRAKDCLIKMRKYLNAGVREYWIIDPKNEAVLVYLFEEDPVPTSFTFNDNIPIGLSKGECTVDFGKIKRKLEAARGWNIPGADL